MAAEVKKESMRIKRIKSIDTALRIFYTYPEIGSAEIKELFGPLGDSTLRRYKKPVEIRQSELKIVVSRRFAINTKVAFEVWGIDVTDLEERREKLKKLGLSA